MPSYAHPWPWAEVGGKFPIHLALYISWLVRKVQCFFYQHKGIPILYCHTIAIAIISRKCVELSSVSMCITLSQQMVRMIRESTLLTKLVPTIHAEPSIPLSILVILDPIFVFQHPSDEPHGQCLVDVVVHYHPIPYKIAVETHNNVWE